MRAVKQGLRVNGRACAGDLLEGTAFFAGDANAVARMVDEKIAFAVGTVAMNVIFLGKVTENEKDHVADMLIAVEIVSLIGFSNARKLGIVDDCTELVIRKLNGLQNGTLGADEKNIDSCVSAREGEQLSGHQELARNNVMMRSGAENAGDGQTELSFFRFLHNELGAAAGTFEFDHVSREGERTDNAENGGAAYGATIGNGCVLGL